MGFKKILDRIEDKLEKYEEEMDEDEVPPWYGSESEEEEDSTEEDPTEDESPDMTTVGSFNLDEDDEEVTIRILLPGVPEDNIEVTLEEDGVLLIDVEESETVDERNYQYELPEDADPTSIQADYDQGLLVITVGRN